MVDHGRPGDTVGLTVARTPRGVGALRRFAVDASVALGWGRSRDAVALLVTEVATNAVLHARGTEIRVRLHGQSTRLRVEVDDASPDLPRTRAAQAGAEDGRGLALVDALASVWGVDRRDGGKTFWFEITA